MIGPKVTPPTPREEREAYELATLRDLDTCQRCRRDCGPTARDHRKNQSQGVWTVLSDLQVLGLACHIWKTEHPEEAVRDGWAVPGWPRADWREWPAARYVLHPLGYRELVWVLYLDREEDDGKWWVVITEKEARERMLSMGWAA